MYFLIEDDDDEDYWKNIILFGIKSTMILKKELDSEPFYNKNILATKIKSSGHEITEFYDMKLLSFVIKKFQRWTIIILV